MLDKKSTTYSCDIPLFEELGLKIFEVENHIETYVGEVDNDYWNVKIWVECAPAQFWKFEIFNKELETITYNFRTGSGGFTDYWEIAKKLADGMITFDKIHNI